MHFQKSKNSKEFSSPQVKWNEITDTRKSMHYLPYVLPNNSRSHFLESQEIRNSQKNVRNDCLIVSTKSAFPNANFDICARKCES